MLDSLLLNNKCFSCLLLILISVSFASSLEFGVSPSKLFYEIEVGEKECKNISLFSDRSVFLELNDLWNIEDDSRKLSKFRENFTGETEYTRNVEVNGKKEVLVCFRPDSRGEKRGVLIISTLNGSFSVGSWLYVNVLEENSEDESKLLEITGFVSRENFDDLKIGLSVGMVLLGILLILILFGMFRNK